LSTRSGASSPLYVCDVDAGGIDDAFDNCLKLANADPADLDGDGEGDVCDDDVDGDEVADTDDNCTRLVNPCRSTPTATASPTSSTSQRPGRSFYSHPVPAASRPDTKQMRTDKMGTDHGFFNRGLSPFRLPGEALALPK
jgi:hypothetical protein